MEYLNKRGGRIVLHNIEAPEKQEWGSAQEAMTAALELEKIVNEVCCSYLRTNCFVVFRYRGLENEDYARPKSFTLSKLYV